MMARVFFLLCAVAALACGATVDPASPTGGSTTSYTLASINGKRVPAVLGENPIGKMEILAESYRLEPTLRYKRVQEYRQTDNAGVRTGTLTDSGTYVLRPDSIFFTFNRPDGTFQVLGAIESGRMVVRLAAQGVTLVYESSR